MTTSIFFATHSHFFALLNFVFENKAFWAIYWRIDSETKTKTVKKVQEFDAMALGKNANAKKYSHYLPCYCVNG
jgi:hypothetical protein